jgi:RimJ/RimL family protein N-acetyltransferase
MRADDAPAWAAIAGDPAVTRLVSWPPVASAAEAVSRLAAIAEAAAARPRRAYYLAVEDLTSGELLGGGALDILSRTDGHGEIGYYLRPDAWGRGLGTEVAGLLLVLAFERLDLHRVQATIDPENVASMRVLERVGLRREGYLRELYRVGDGWRDRVLYAIVRSDWPGPGAS